MLHCPKCDAIFDEQENACAETTCPRCGGIVRTAAAIELADPSAGLGSVGHGAQPSFTHASHGSGFSLSGHAGTLRWTKNVAVRLTRSLCPGCGQKVGKKMSACPHCGRLLKKGSEPASGKFAPALRKMLIAATVFIGLPAGVIVFVLVVCAPKGGEVGTNTPGPVAADRVAPRPGAEPLKANGDPKAEHRGLLSALRAIRDRLRGAEHGGSSIPAKTPLEKTGNGTGDARVPPVGTRDGEQVKPDPIR